MMARSALISSLLSVLLLTIAEGSAAAEQRVVWIKKADCAWLVKHEPAPDTAYQPGVDVEGRPVAPADLDAQRLQLPERTRIAITVDLQDRFGIPANSALFEGEVAVGEVVVRGDQITFNGEPLYDPEIRALAEGCRRSAPDPQ
ncbi:hypothetical protein [Rhodospirillaceae bacterium SYSU D60014]|uniref:hypothetical protein n=1 Tax=Virgifigura deserti TaxID=2268457 RepID=UPI000E6666D3